MDLLDTIELRDPETYYSDDKIMKADKWIQLYNKETRETDQTEKQLKQDIENL